MAVWVWIVIAIVAVVIIAIAVWMAISRSRTARLREQFGPEYEREVNRRQDRQAAESELTARRERVESLDIRPLDPDARRRYAARWEEVQARFVDDPRSALADADRLILQVMEERGYPTRDFERRTADVSVRHPKVVQDYRTAHEISQSAAAQRADTEDMREGLVHYRALFEQLLDEAETEGRREAG